MKFKRPVSAYVKKLPVMGRQDPYNKDVTRFWVEVPKVDIVDARHPRLFLGWCLLRLFWRAWRQGGMP